MLKCAIVGNVGSDPDLRYSASGQAMLRFNIASNGRTRNPDGEWVESTEWCRVTVLGARAESLAQHITRGTKLYIDGRLETRPWLDRQNEPKAGLELLADTIEFAGNRQDDGGGQQQRHPSTTGSGYATGQPRQQNGQQQRQPAAQGARRGPTNDRGQTVPDDADFDLPF
jgi:single-strand DNA-binding protein